MIKILLTLICFLSISNAAECSYQYVYQQKLIFDKTGNSQSECDAIKSEKEALVQQYEGSATTSSSNTNDGTTSSNTSASSAASNTTTAKTTSSSAASSSGQSVNTTGGCGMPPSFLRSSDAMSFSGNTLNKGLSSVQQSDFDNIAFKSGDAGNFSGFSCPQVSEIKDASFPKNITAEDGTKGYSVKISNINFYTGAYTCEYNFLKSKTFYTLKRVNKACAQDAEAINKSIAKGDINSLPNLSYSQNYGMYTFNEGTINASDDFKKTYSNLLKGIADLGKSESKVAPVDIGSSLDSHSNHTNTLPSLFLGILTGDMEFLNNPVIDNSGKIRIKNTNIDTSINMNDIKDIESLEQKFVSIFKSLDTQFWGFYYYLIANISHAFNHIVTMIFGLGTVGTFGYAFFRRSIDRDKESGAQFQFDFKNNFISAISALILFTAPIIPADKGIPSSFLYQPSTAPSSAQQEEILKNATVVQVGVRYIFQLGTYWANLIHDYSMFAYLKFISSSYGYYDASEMRKNFKDDMSEFVTRSVLLKKQMDFFEKSCGTNYFSHLTNDHTLPNYYGGVDTNINYLKDNPLGFESVDYNTCSTMFQKIQQESSNNFTNYKDIINGYSTMSNNMQSFLDSDMQEINGFISLVINVSNKLGWVSIALVPSITDILETKKIFTFSKRSESINEGIVDAVGKMEVKKVDLVKRNELEAGKSSAIKEDVKGEESSDTWRSIKSFFDTYDGASGKVGKGLGMTMGFIASKFGYFMFPGFGELYSGIEKTSIPSAIGGGISRATEFFAKFVPGIGGVLELSKSINKIKFINQTDSSDAKGIMTFFLTYIICVFLYVTLLSILVVALVTLLTISKIIYYFIEVIIAVFISTAVMLWGLVFDKNSSSSTIGEFFYKIVLLALSPISIVLSIYAFLFAKGAMLWLYRLIAEFILVASLDIVEKLDSKNDGFASTVGLDNILAGIQAYGVYNMGEMILVFFTIFIAYNIIFHFHDWVLGYFGHKGDTGIQRNMDAVFQEVKQRAMTKV